VSKAYLAGSLRHKVLHYERKGMDRQAFKIIASSFCLIIFGAVAIGQTQNASDRIKVMKEELIRNFEGLQKEPVPPYYMSYSIDDVRTQYVTGSFGAITGMADNKVSYLRIDIRTGSYHLDSSHEIRGDSLSALQRRLDRGVQAPLNKSPDALKVILWRETDRAYRRAVESLAKVKSQRSVMVAEEDKSDDFSKMEPEIFLENRSEVRVDLAKWAARIRKYTERFKQHPYILNSTGSFQNEIRQKYFVNTEGSLISFPATYMRLQISATAKADDGMELPLYLSYFGFKESDFPEEDQVMAEIGSLIETLNKIRTASMVEPYTGPAILSGKASGVFFHEILGHRLEGHRQKSETEGQTFKKQVGKPILPEFISVIFDPTIKEFRGFQLSGFYDFDDEGTRAHRVVSIDKGVLRNFLMSRSPIEGFPISNGHGRSQPGLKPVSRQSNLIVQSDKMLSEDQLRKMLIEECKKQGKAFGLIFEEIAGGYTSTGRSSPNAFNVTPLVVYRVFTDGRADELVRGVDLIGTPLTTFGKIIATGSQLEVFNGICGAESGSVPVSAVSPSILVSEIEVQKKEKSQEKPPILPPPAIH
jgi:TldD protein